MVMLGTREDTAEAGAKLLSSFRGQADTYRFFLRKTIEWEASKPDNPRPGVNDSTALLILAYLAYCTTISETPEQEVVNRVAQSSGVSRDTAEGVLRFWQHTGLIYQGEMREIWVFRHAGFREFGIALALKDMKRSAEGNQEFRSLREEMRFQPEWQTTWQLLASLEASE